MVRSTRPGISRFRVPSLPSRPGTTDENPKAAQLARLSVFGARLKIRGDAFVFPVAIAGWFRTLRALKFFRRRLGVCLGGFSPRLGFSERALWRRRGVLAVRRGSRGWH